MSCSLDSTHGFSSFESSKNFGPIRFGFQIQIEKRTSLMLMPITFDWSTNISFSWTTKFTGTKFNCTNLKCYQMFLAFLYQQLYWHFLMYFNLNWKLLPWKKQTNEKFVRFGIRIGSSYELNKIKFVIKTFESF